MIKVGEMRKVGFSIEGLSIYDKCHLNNIFHIKLHLESLRPVDYKNREFFILNCYSRRKILPNFKIINLMKNKSW